MLAIARATWPLRFQQFAPCGSCRSYYWVIDPANRRCYIESSRSDIIQLSGSVGGDVTLAAHEEDAL
jgi:hypothetical protein